MPGLEIDLYLRELIRFLKAWRYPMLKRRNFLHMSAALLLGISIIGSPLVDTSQAAEMRLALKGYDPVAYFTERRPILGKPDFEYAWDEVRYRFASEQH